MTDPRSDRPVLTALGASSHDDKVYRYLVSVTSATAKDVAAGLKTSPDDVQTSLSVLETRGLVSRTPGQPTRFVATNPAAVEQLLTEAQQRIQVQLAEAWTALADLNTYYHAQQHDRDVNELIEVVRGREAVAVHTRRTQLNARKEILAMMRPPIVALHADEALSAKTAPEVTSKLLYDARMVTDRAMLEAIATAQQPREENRVLTGVPIKLIIVDRSEAMLPLGRGDAPALTALVVRGSGLLDALIALFEYAWSVSTPLDLLGPGQRGSDGSPLSPDDRQLISLIIAGLTDDAIAARLGVSRRTAQRRIRALEDAVGVQTRMELLWAVATRGWMS